MWPATLLGTLALFCSAIQGQEMLAYMDCEYPDMYLPICGSDGKDYFNFDQMICIASKHPERNVTILREGHCEWSENVKCEDRVPQFDESISNGLCGSDGVTYLTAQQFKCVRNEKKDLKLLHDGACKISEIPKDITPQVACEIENKYPVVAPVCGSDGNTYMSIFSLWCQSANLKGLLVLHPGECNSESSVCQAADETASIDLPYICANNGNTYVNLYAFWCDKIEKPDIEVSHFDECC
ncbi:hypothetical protein C0J52_00813 [Blattella germanica]|nr:hypothetical protein C0J52_00813 [Blattella germanica]